MQKQLDATKELLLRYIKGLQRTLRESPTEHEKLLMASATYSADFLEYANGFWHRTLVSAIKSFRKPGYPRSYHHLNACEDVLQFIELLIDKELRHRNGFWYTDEYPVYLTEKNKKLASELSALVIEAYPQDHCQIAPDAYWRQ